MTLLKISPLLALGFFVSCKDKPAPPKPQPMEVTVAKPVQRDVIVHRKFPATMVGAAEVEIRARVKGVLEETYFKEGDVVEKGSPLFLIEPDTYELAMTAAKADLSQAQASQQLAESRYKRVEKASRTNAVSQIDVEVAAAELAQAKASVSQAQAGLADATLNHSYTTIHAPVTGRMSRIMVDVGNLVGNADATLLSTIIDDSTISAYFEVPERAMIRYLGERALEGGIERFADKPITLELANDLPYDQTGKIDFINNRIDPSTRTAQVRAVFPNDKAKLSSGLYGLVGFPAGPDPENATKKSAILIPSVAVLRDLGGDFVWIVDEKNTVSRRGIEVGDTVEKPTTDPKMVRERETVVIRGLDGTENVIVAGLQRARGGAVVAPKTAP